MLRAAAGSLNRFEDYDSLLERFQDRRGAADGSPTALDADERRWVS